MLFAAFEIQRARWVEDDIEYSPLGGLDARGACGIVSDNAQRNRHNVRLQRRDLQTKIRPACRWRHGSRWAGPGSFRQASDLNGLIIPGTREHLSVQSSGLTDE